MTEMFFESYFNKSLHSWNVKNLMHLTNIFSEEQLKNAPYWAKIEDFDERQLALDTYQKSLKEKALLETEIILKNNIDIKEKSFKI